MTFVLCFTNIIDRNIYGDPVTQRESLSLSGCHAERCLFVHAAFVESTNFSIPSQKEKKGGKKSAAAAANLKVKFAVNCTLRRSCGKNSSDVHHFAFYALLL